MTIIVIFIALILLYTLVSKRLDGTKLTAPMVFTSAGLLAFLVLPTLQEQQVNIDVFMKVAEVGLVLLLFTDASRIDLKVLKSMRNLPVRLLSVGMLLTILFGALGALVVFHQLSVLEAGILAAILAPTDAGLGQIIVNSPRVPMKIRQALNVEPGLGLTVVRMLPVAIALSGTRLSVATVLFMGWFGPRGLASIVLGLVYIEHSMHQEGLFTIRLAVMATVFLSIFAHGLSAAPGMEFYARKIAELAPSAPEHGNGQSQLAGPDSD